MKIAQHDITEKVFIIAEIGSNHEGVLEKALELVNMAADCRVDAVKFQSYRAESIVTNIEKEIQDHFRRFSLPEEAFVTLAAEAKNRNVLFLSSPFDEEYVDFLEPLVPAYKVASGELSNYLLLEKIAAKGKPIIMSTGLSTVEEIQTSLEVIKGVNRRIVLDKEIALLHCVSGYSVPYDEARLSAIPQLSEYFKIPIGYSDHTVGILACKVAVALGARIIEKHFTDKKEGRSFRDHTLSADMTGMREIVNEVRNIEVLLGSGDIKVSECALENRYKLQRGLYAKRDLPPGTVVSKDDLIALRPVKGIPADSVYKVVGLQAKKLIKSGSPLSFDYFYER